MNTVVNGLVVHLSVHPINTFEVVSFDAWTKLVLSHASVGDTSASIYSSMSMLKLGFNVIWGTSSNASSSVAYIEKRC